MHWLHDNWPMVLGWALYVLSDLMPILPGKAQSVAGALLNVGKAILGAGKKGADALPPK